jgi:MFS family permease
VAFARSRAPQWAALRYVAGNRALRRLDGLSWAVPAFGSVADGLAVAYTAQTGRAAAAAGALFTGYAAGTMLGEIVVARLRPDTRRRLVLPLILASQLPLVAFLAHPNLPIAAVLLTIAGSGFAFNQGLDPLILTATADTYRGRVFTVQGSGLMTVGIALAGLAGSILAPNLVIAAAGVLGTLITQGLAHRALPNRRVSNEAGDKQCCSQPT